MYCSPRPLTVLKCFCRACLLVCAFVLQTAPTAPAHAALPAIIILPLTFTVNSTADVVASAPLDNGVCETAPGNNVCTLRAAIMKANHYPGGGALIRLPPLPPGNRYVLTSPAAGTDDETTGDLNITAPMTIVGGGAGDTVIDGNGLVTASRVIQIAAGISAHISAVSIEGGHLDRMDYGAGIKNQGTLILGDSAVHDNECSASCIGGGAIENDGTLTVTNSILSRNLGGGGGGGVESNTLTSARLQNVTLDDNSAYEGGGILNIGIGSMTVLGSAIVSNTATYGGGIYNDGVPMLVINSTVSANSALGEGGGICNCSANSTLRLYNVTIAFNRADADANGSGHGGGVANLGSGSTLTFRNSLIARNSETFYSNLCLCYLSTNGDCSGTIMSEGYGILQTYNKSYCTVGGPITFADPRLGPLQNNGGPTLTHALLPGSPALDAGEQPRCTDNLGAPILNDQRGYPRPFPPFPVGGHCDIGAFEFGHWLYLPLLVR